MNAKNLKESSTNKSLRENSIEFNPMNQTINIKKILRITILQNSYTNRLNKRSPYLLSTKASGKNLMFALFRLHHLFARYKSLWKAFDVCSVPSTPFIRRVQKPLELGKGGDSSSGTCI